MNGPIVNIPVDKLEIQDQKHRTKLEISALVESIQSIGQLNPVFLKKDGNKYLVIAGRRRTSALQTIQALSGKKQKIKAIILHTDKLTEELITIDENIMREDLSADEFDEALYRRKQIYEELHPDTKQHVAGGVGKHSKKDEKKPTKSFTSDSATRLKISQRTVEKSIARASKASDEVKKARKKGNISPSQVDLLVGLNTDEQDLLLPLITKKDFKESKDLVARAKKIGAKATVLYIEEEKDVDDVRELRAIVKDATRLRDMIEAALKSRHVFRSNAKFQHIRMLEGISEIIEKFTDYQRVALGQVRTLRRSKADQKAIRISARS